MDYNLTFVIVARFRAVISVVPLDSAGMSAFGLLFVLKTRCEGR